MKHHFGDLLDRNDDYWTIVPNMARYAYDVDHEIADKDAVKILTISKHHEKWEQVFDCSNLEELTLNDPSKEQVQAIHKLIQLKRLRLSFFRAKDIEFIRHLPNLEEVVFEYVSGFSDLSPFQDLKKLKSLHFENLRKVSYFDGLRGIESLKYLHIDGTLDWKQPIDNFLFLEGLPNLEIFSLGFVVNTSPFPALFPIINLKKLKRIKIGRNTLETNEYAFLQSALKGVEGCSWSLTWDYNGSYNFLGKRSGSVKKTNTNAGIKCDEFIRFYEELKIQCQAILDEYYGRS